MNFQKQVSSCIQWVVATWEEGTKNIHYDQLAFVHRDEAFLGAAGILGVICVMLAVRLLRKTSAAVVIPAVLKNFHRTPFRMVRFFPLLCWVSGFVFFLVALADPMERFVREDTVHLGKRVVILVDMSSSMGSDFETDALSKKKTTKEKGVFYAVMAAAQAFIELRMKHNYGDLVGLVEFGIDAHVVTPFTIDYENILTSLVLAGDPYDWGRIPSIEKGTIIMKGIEQSVELFREFDFLKSSGNAIVLFSDGEDNQVIDGVKTLDEILVTARKHDIPIFFIRAHYDRTFEKDRSTYYSVNDDVWEDAVKKTNGKYYKVADEPSLIAALQDIDRLTPGVIKTPRYVANSPRFPFFALMAVCCWSVGLGGLLAFRMFRQFP